MESKPTSLPLLRLPGHGFSVWLPNRQNPSSYSAPATTPGLAEPAVTSVNDIESALAEFENLETASASATTAATSTATKEPVARVIKLGPNKSEPKEETAKPLPALEPEAAAAAETPAAPANFSLLAKLAAEMKINETPAAAAKEPAASPMPVLPPLTMLPPLSTLVADLGQAKATESTPVAAPRPTSTPHRPFNHTEEPEMPAITIGSLPPAPAPLATDIPNAPVFFETAPEAAPQPAALLEPEPEMESEPEPEPKPEPEPQPEAKIEQPVAPVAPVAPVDDVPTTPAKPPFFATKVNRLWKYAAMIALCGWYISHKDNQTNEANAKSAQSTVTTTAEALAIASKAKSEAESLKTEATERIQALSKLTNELKTTKEQESASAQKQLEATRLTLKENNQKAQAALDAAQISIRENGAKVAALEEAKAALQSELAKAKRDCAEALTSAKAEAAKWEAEKAASVKVNATAAPAAPR